MINCTFYKRKPRKCKISPKNLQISKLFCTFAVAKKNGMKKLLCFICFGLMMLTATAAEPTREVAQMQSDAVVLTGIYAQPEFADFVLVPYDMSMNTTAPEETHVYYDAPFADWDVPVFDISLPVLRLCGGEYSHNTYSQKSQNCAPANNTRVTARYVRS